MEYCNENNYLVFVTNTTKRATHSRSFLTQILNLTNETNQANNTQNECEIIVENFSYDGCLEDVPTPTTTQTLSESLTISHTTILAGIQPSATLHSMCNLTSMLYTTQSSPTPVPFTDSIFNSFNKDVILKEGSITELQKFVINTVSFLTLILLPWSVMAPHNGNRHIEPDLYIDVL